jgi:hypothetical protein
VISQRKNPSSSLDRIEMAILYIDDSGNTLYDSGTSYFVYAGVLVSSKKYCDQTLEKMKNKYEENFGKKFRKNELRFSGLTDKERDFFSRELENSDFYIFYITLKTETPFPPIKKALDEDIKVRGELLSHLVSHACTISTKVPESVVIDKTGGWEKIKKQLTEMVSKIKKSQKPKIEFKSSENYSGIQMADAVAWLIRKLYQEEIDHYPELMKKVVFQADYPTSWKGTWDGFGSPLIVVDTINKKI